MCETEPKYLYWAPQLCTQIWVRAMIGLFKRPLSISGNSLSPLGAQNGDLGAASQTLLTGNKLRLRRRLQNAFYAGYLVT